MKGRNTLMPVNEMFDVMKVLVEALNDLYFPLLPEHTPNVKVMDVLKTTTRMWSSVDFHEAVQLVSLISRDRQKCTVKRGQKQLLNCVSIPCTGSGL